MVFVSVFVGSPTSSTTVIINSLAFSLGVGGYCAREGFCYYNEADYHFTLLALRMANT